jgi:cytochrome c peroxidase
MSIFPIRSTTLICSALTAGIVVAGLASAGFCAAIVGKTYYLDASPKTLAGIAALKELYHRLASIEFPASNPYTAEKASLGKKLFFDTRLSVTSSQSCASCHNPGFGWGDGLPVGIGHGMEKLGRRSPSVVNVAWGAVFMWDGRAASLEEQALGPIQSPREMDMPIELLMDRITAISGYRPLFETAFPGEGLTPDTLAKAIATFERTIVSERAPFDAWIDGDEQAISEEAKRGFVIFNTKGQCSSCHEGWNFTNDGFQDIGLPDADPGRGKFLPNILAMRHAFKTPGLREIVSRSPYMHNGSLQTLEDVIEHYDSGGVDRSSRSDLIKKLHLTSLEKGDLVAFLKTLTSNLGPMAVPVLPR